MEFFRRATGRPHFNPELGGRTACHVAPLNVGILAGAFNPVTVAHLALARAALSQAGSHLGEVVFVLPKIFPHKPYHGAPFAERVQILHAALAGEPAFSIAAADGGLFVEIAAECREAYGEDVRLTFLCGRDAAERILNWDYGDNYGGPDAANKLLRQFDLLVAARRGELEIVANARHSVRMLALDGDFDHVSSTEVRDRIAQGLPWEHLAPEGARDLVRRVYG